MHAERKRFEEKTKTGETFNDSYPNIDNPYRSAACIACVVN